MSLDIRKWLEIVRFELRYQFRRGSTWFFFAVFLMLLMGQTNGDVMNARDGEALFNAPLSIARSSVGMALIGLLVMAAVAGDAATRDIETRIEALMHVAPMSRGAYLGGRFLGAFLVSALMLLTVPLALILAPLIHPDLSAELAGPFSLTAHLQSFFLLVLPNAFVATAILFSLAALVRHTLGSYLGAAMVVAATALTKPFLGTSLGLWKLAKLLNPAGHTPLAVMARTWSPDELDSRLVGLSGGLLWNRLLWLTVALALLTFTYTRFRCGGSAGDVRWWQSAWRRMGVIAVATGGRIEAAVIAPGVPLAAPLATQLSPLSFGVAGRVRQTLTIARDSLREVLTGWSWLVLPFMAWQVIFGLDQLAMRDTPLLPTTSAVLGALQGALLMLRTFGVTFLAGELVWRERDANMQALADVAPVSNWTRFAGKLLGLWLVIVALHALLMVSGVILQVQRGWYDFNPALYLQVLFGLELIPALVYASFALSVHVVVNQKHAGHVAVMMLVIAPALIAPLLGLEHPLLFPNPRPLWRHSEISGFGASLAPALWYSLYWAGWAVLLALVAGCFWVRGTRVGFAERVRLARSRFTSFGALTGVVGVVLFAGGFIFYNTNILNDYVTSGERRQMQVEYERRYGRYRSVPQPQVTATRLHVELYPDRRAADVRGEYRLENRTARPIDTIHVAVSPEVETGEIEFGIPARARVVDDDLRHRTYRLEQPLQPAQSLPMRWQVRHHARGFPAGSASKAVVGNGSFIVMVGWMPLIGYQDGRELKDAVERKEHGLVPRPDVRPLEDAAARQERRDRVDLEVTVGTAATQTAVAPGELLGTWQRGGRRYFHYATNAPIGQGYAIFSAKYAVRRSRAGEVALEVVHHPGHSLNVGRMIRGMEVALAQYTRRFGPYPHKVLRMVEYPTDDSGAHAAESAIWYSEIFARLDAAADERRIDLPFGVVAHEVAHQFQPQLARVEGRALLSESFAWYAALSVIEEEHGTAHLQRFLAFMREDYLSPRARADVPLLRATDFFLAYRKGPFAMYALREYVGQEKVDLAWRRLIARHRSGEPPLATSLDLYAELQAVTPAPLRTLLADLLERNTFWELKTRQATVRQTAAGAWEVTLDVTARKIAVDTEGAETDIPMNDPIEIGIYAPAEPGETRGKELYRSMHRVRTGPQTITITVPQRPAGAGIDPRHLLIDVEPDDKVVAVAEPTTSSAGGPTRGRTSFSVK